MKKQFFLFLVIVFGFGSSLLGNETLKIDSIKMSKGKLIEIDPLGNLYITTATNDIIKYDSKGKLLATVNYKVLGNISWIDASNPFEIYVFYRDQNKLIILDNLLNQHSVI